MISSLQPQRPGTRRMSSNAQNSPFDGPQSQQRRQEHMVSHGDGEDGVEDGTKTSGRDGEEKEHESANPAGDGVDESRQA